MNFIHIILNLVFMGMVFDGKMNHFIWVLLIFMAGVIATTTLEMTTIRFIQKNDPRLKGDPTTMRFHKDYVESCDEAEQLRIYKAGYQSYMFSRNVAFGLLIFTIVLNMVLDIGGMTILAIGVILLSQILSYYRYATYKALV